MQSDNKPIQETSFTAPEKVAVKEVLAMLLDVCSVFSTHISEKYGDEVNTKLAENENFYNQDLQLLLQEKSSDMIKIDENKKSYLFQYQHVPYSEYLSKKKGIQPTVEIGVFLSSTQKNAFFTIECKRLRTEDKSKQYVTGKTGGIKRFKENQHGQYTHDSAMVGYMEDENFNFWFEKVNVWIEQESQVDNLWTVNDSLLPDSESKIVATYKSIHNRKDRIESINLTHFWIKMNV